jgi:hypothetical protein
VLAQQIAMPAASRALARRIRAIAVQARTNRAHTQTLKKKALQAQQQIRNSLRMCPHVLFFRAIRYARRGPRACI